MASLLYYKISLRFNMSIFGGSMQRCVQILLKVLLSAKILYRNIWKTKFENIIFSLLLFNILLFICINILKNISFWFMIT